MTAPPACSCTGAIEPDDSNVVVIDGTPAWHRPCYDLAHKALPLVVEAGVLVDAWWRGDLAGTVRGENVRLPVEAPAVKDGTEP